MVGRKEEESERKREREGGNKQYSPTQTPTDLIYIMHLTTAILQRMVDTSEKKKIGQHSGSSKATHLMLKATHSLALQPPPVLVRLDSLVKAKQIQQNCQP